MTSTTPPIAWKISAKQELGASHHRSHRANGDAIALSNQLSDEEYAELLQRHGRSIRTFIGKLVPNVADGDDIAGQTGLTLWGKRGCYDSEKSFIKWACGIAYIEVKRWREQLGKSKLFFSTDTLELLQSDAIDDVDDDVDHDVLSHCLAKLNERDRTLIESRYKLGLPVAEIATRFDMQLSATYKTLDRIRERLRESFERSLADRVFARVCVLGRSSGEFCKSDCCDGREFCRYIHIFQSKTRASGWIKCAKASAPLGFTGTTSSLRGSLCK